MTLSNDIAANSTKLCRRFLEHRRIITPVSAKRHGSTIATAVTCNMCRAAGFQDANTQPMFGLAVILPYPVHPARLDCLNMDANVMPFMRRHPRVISNNFVHCSEAGCVVSSGVGQYTSDDDQDWAIVLHRPHEDERGREQDEGRSQPREHDPNLLPCTEAGETFSAYMRTSVRANTSPFLRKITPRFYNLPTSPAT
jgi:hypothetical protein